MKFNFKKMPPLGKYLSIFTFILLVVMTVVSLTRSLGAQEESGTIQYARERTETYEDPNPDFGEGLAEYTDECNCANGPTIECFTCAVKGAEMVTWAGGLGGPRTEPQTEGGDSLVDGGLLQATGKLLSFSFTPVASGAYFVADALNNMGVTTTAYAQGYGYYALDPYLQIWRLMRNISYIFFTMIIIVIAFLILFRQKVGNQAAVTAQQALPRIVMALLMVTFSYAVAGFLIDAMYWVMYMFAIFVSVDGATQATELVNSGFMGVVSAIMVGNSANINQAINGIMNGIFGDFTSLTTLFTLGLSFAANKITGGILYLIVMGTLLFNLFRLLFLLLKSFAAVLLYTIFSPFYLMMYAVPGTNAFRNWVMKIIANLSPFVITFFLIVIVGMVNEYVKTSDSVTGFLPPYILVGDAVSTNIGGILALGILLAIPETVKAIKDKLGGGAGFFEQMFDNAGANFNKTRQNKTMKTVAGAVGGVGMGAAGGIAGGLVGGAIGGIRSARAGTGFWQGARQGATTGGLVGAGAVGTVGGVAGSDSLAAAGATAVGAIGGAAVGSIVGSRMRDERGNAQTGRGAAIGAVGGFRSVVGSVGAAITQGASSRLLAGSTFSKGFDGYLQENFMSENLSKRTPEAIKNVIKGRTEFDAMYKNANADAADPGLATNQLDYAVLWLSRYPNYQKYMQDDTRQPYSRQQAQK